MKDRRRVAPQSGGCRFKVATRKPQRYLPRVVPKTASETPYQAIVQVTLENQKAKAERSREEMKRASLVIPKTESALSSSHTVKSASITPVTERMPGFPGIIAPELKGSNAARREA